MYTAAAGMAAQETRLASVANDLANVNTNGYKHVRLAFRDLVEQQQGHGAAAGVTVGAGAAATVLGRSAAQGALRQTGEPLDVAIDGPGYLQVRGRDGRPSLTRDGALRTDDRGRLSTESGLLLDPPVTLPRGVTEKEVVIGDDGTVRARGAVVGTLRVVTVRAPGQLQGGPDNTFRTTPASGPATAAGRTSRVIQGSLEASNVDMADAMTDLIDAQRGFQLTSKVIQFGDQMLEIANGVKR